MQTTCGLLLFACGVLLAEQRITGARVPALDNAGHVLPTVA